MPSAVLPKNWPPTLPYLKLPTYSKHLPRTTLTSLRNEPTDPTIPLIPNVTRGPSPLVKITPISTSTHPANGQSGLFATKDLKPGSFILLYIGQLHDSTTNEHAESDYDLSLDRELGVGIDAARMGNEARFINDYRGVTSRPNAEFKEVWDVSRGERGMGVFALPERKDGGGKREGKSKGVGIAKGEEILVSYGRGFWGARRGEGADGGEG